MSETVSTESFLDAARARTELLEAETPGQRQVQDVVMRNVGRYFAPDPGGAARFALNPDLHPGSVPIGSAEREVVSWEFVGVHARSFRGVSATGRPVWFRGLTVVDRSQERLRLHHFVDWREVLIQLGVAPEATRALQGREDAERLDLVRSIGWPEADAVDGTASPRRQQ